MDDDTAGPEGQHKLLLFDIDGTLIRSAGAGRAAMNRAFEVVWHIPEAMNGVPMMGRTDPLILDEVLEKHGIEGSEEDRKHFKETYFEILETTLVESREEQRICPGVFPLLEALSERSDLVMGLLTGNWRYGAYLKLRHFEMDRFFEVGAFADDGRERSDLVPVAMARYQEYHGRPILPERVYIIGDTPMDIQCGRPHGVRTLAVATGEHTLDMLRPENPDALFADLSELDLVLSVFKDDLFPSPVR